MFNVAIFISFSSSIKTWQFCWEELCAFKNGSHKHCLTHLVVCRPSVAFMSTFYSTLLFKYVVLSSLSCTTCPKHRLIELHTQISLSGHFWALIERISLAQYDPTTRPYVVYFIVKYILGYCNQGCAYIKLTNMKSVSLLVIDFYWTHYLYLGKFSKQLHIRNQ